MRRSTKVCKATSGPGAGSACVFPFDYLGVHSSCTTIHGFEPWCATENGLWGYCDLTSCPVEGTAPTTSTSTIVCNATSGPGAGSACDFPFDYLGVHSSCITIHGIEPWCATKMDSGDIVILLVALLKELP